MPLGRGESTYEKTVRLQHSIRDSESGSHKITIKEVKQPRGVSFRAVCSCGWEGSLQRTRLAALEQAEKHLH